MTPWPAGITNGDASCETTSSLDGIRTDRLRRLLRAAGVDSTPQSPTSGYLPVCAMLVGARARRSTMPLLVGAMLVGAIHG